jgi:hypothetical protein
MSSVQEIETAIEHLPPDEFKRLREWLDTFETTAFDRQIATDSDSGALDFLIYELEDDIQHGRTKPLHEVLGKS